MAFVSERPIIEMIWRRSLRATAFEGTSGRSGSVNEPAGYFSGSMIKYGSVWESGLKEPSKRCRWSEALTQEVNLEMESCVQTRDLGLPAERLPPSLIEPRMPKLSIS